jgi:outer membrane lipoprotein-sorting protein
MGAAAVASAADWSLEQLMRSLAQVKSAKAHFIERKDMEILSSPLESSGTLIYTAPDRLEKHTLKPRQESLVLEGNRLTLESKARNQLRTFELQEQPVIGAFVESIRSTLAGDLGTLKRYYEVRLTGGESEWQLHLTPSAPDMRRFVSEIRISGSRSMIRTIEITEVQGDRSVMTIKPDSRRAP